MKVVNTYEYVSVLRELVNEGRDVNMLISGDSMSPFLRHEQDYIHFHKPERELRKGDMVFFERDGGYFVMHRIYRVNGDGTYDIVGDGQRIVEPSIRRDQIFARIFAVTHKGKLIGPGNLWWDFFEKVWINIVPLRPVVWKLYTPISKLKKMAGRRGA